MGEKKRKEETFSCPVGAFFKDFETAFGGKSPFYKHMTRSKIEFLKGVKSLLDERIQRLEQKDAKKAGAKMTKVKVE